jgi:hypothetical protein
MLSREEISMVVNGWKLPGKGTTVDSQAGGGVIIVSLSVTDALLAVTVTSKPSVTVI